MPWCPYSRVAVQYNLCVQLFLAEGLYCSSCLTEGGADVVDRLALETEAVDLQDLVPGMEAAAPLGRPSLHHPA